MRFRGGGVGHTSTREATDKFCSDRHDDELIGDNHAASPQAGHQADSEDNATDNMGADVEDSGDGEDEGGETAEDDFYLEEEVEQQWHEGQASTPLVEEGLELRTNGVGNKTPEPEGVSDSEDSESSSADSEKSSTYGLSDSEDVPQDVLGPEDGQGATNDAEGFGYADL